MNIDWKFNERMPIADIARIHFEQIPKIVV